MTIQLIIYIVRCLDNCEYSNDYKIYHIHRPNDYTIDYIHRQMTIELSTFK